MRSVDTDQLARASYRGIPKQIESEIGTTTLRAFLVTLPASIMKQRDIDTVFTDLNIKAGLFISEEYNKTKKFIREGKGCGEDKIRPKILKQGKIDDLLNFCNTALIKRISLEQWSISNLVPIPKAGNPSKGRNYHGIVLGSVVLKTCNRIILNRIRPEIDCKLRINQNGSRKGRTTISQILALRRIIEGAKEFNCKAIITFIDFSKVFDTIYHDQMFKIIHAYGIPEQLVNVIKDMYSNT